MTLLSLELDWLTNGRELNEPEVGGTDVSFAYSLRLDNQGTFTSKMPRFSTSKTSTTQRRNMYSMHSYNDYSATSSSATFSWIF